MREIGSEFHNESSTIGYNTFCLDALYAEKRFVLSGRTGLSLIVDELIISHNVKSVALPAYCCASMIYPFVNKGISVLFYPIPASFENITDCELSVAVEVIRSVDAVLVMDYFGFTRNYASSLATLSRELGKTVVVDATQTAFSISDTYPLANYYFVSYRKWSDLLCAIVYSKDKFSSPFSSVTYDEYVYYWRKAAALKKQYLNHEVIDKTEYLQLFIGANSLLSGKYENFTASDDEIARLNAIDTRVLIDKRRKNASHLIDLIKSANMPNVRLMFDHLEDNDCPLFVPILVNEQSRDEIRCKLIAKSIYCPVHWPIDTNYPYCQTQYHNCEISLICDQRYHVGDMDREIEELILVLTE